MFLFPIGRHGLVSSKDDTQIVNLFDVSDLRLSMVNSEAHEIPLRVSRIELANK